MMENNGLGTCRYCEQIVQVEPGQAAEDACNCQKAADIRTAHKRRHEQIAQAKADISECFAGDGSFIALPDATRDELVELLNRAVEPVVDGKLRKVSVQTFGVHGTIGLTAGGKISVERSDTVKMKKES